MADVFGTLFKKGEEERFKAIKDLFSDINIDFKTDLTDVQIHAMGGSEMVNDYIKEEWGIDIKLDDFTHSIKCKLVSRTRLGRGEYVEVLKEKEEDKERGASPSRVRRILGV